VSKVWQLPELQSRVLQTRKPPPHEVPSVFRVQDSVWVVVLLAQEAEAQTGVYTSRDRVPVSSQVLE
tara:strand:+ start:1200 stop:1400 length:201 start_codon:yes stop_codon:yes gene_type:complete